MSDYRAAILTGPRGPFAIVELTPQLHQRLTTGERREVAQCLREKHHRNLPVVFVMASASTLHAIHGVDVTDDLQPCLSGQRPEAIPWFPLDQGAAQL